MRSARNFSLPQVAIGTLHRAPHRPTLGPPSSIGTDVTDAFRSHLRLLLGRDMHDAYRLRYNPEVKVFKPQALR